jgi:hypothetical protein
LIAGFAGAVRWMVKHYLYELRPNGGSSVKDKVDSLETNVELTDRVGKGIVETMSNPWIEPIIPMIPDYDDEEECDDE